VVDQGPLDLNSEKEVWKEFFSSWDAWFKEHHPHYFYSEEDWQALRNLVEISETKRRRKRSQ